MKSLSREEPQDDADLLKLPIYGQMNAPSRRRIRPSSPAAQTDLFAASPRMPEGFRYRAEILSAEEEETLGRELEQLPFKPFDFQGFLANRRVVSF
ncbi:MAG TPA: hypothetical protein VME69_05235, partial [Methylocella sp.]|nr:hypothetical protein [Methylocella sp.]